MVYGELVTELGWPVVETSKNQPILTVVPDRRSLIANKTTKPSSCPMVGSHLTPVLVHTVHTVDLYKSWEHNFVVKVKGDFGRDGDGVKSGGTGV